MISRWLLIALVFGVAAEALALDGPLAPEAEAGALTIEEFLQKLSTVPGVLSRKDPFGKGSPPYAALLQRDVNIPQSDLERYDLNKYMITAVLLGDEYSRALVSIPASGDKASKPKVVIVREQDRLGNRGGVIQKITNDGLVVQQNVRSNRGVVDRTIVTLPVGGIKNDAAPMGGPKR